MRAYFNVCIAFMSFLGVIKYEDCTIIVIVSVHVYGKTPITIFFFNRVKLHRFKHFVTFDSVTKINVIY